MEQVRIDFLVTGNMSSLSGQIQAINAELQQTGALTAMVQKGLGSMDFQNATRQFNQLLASSGQFTTQTVTLRNSTDDYAKSLERARLTGRQYFSESMRYLRGQSGAIRDLANQQIRLQNSVVTPLGRNALGQMQVAVATPTGLPADFATQMRTANKGWEIFNHHAQQGLTHMVNFGKNTQWAGRQLMVGFTVPMMMLGGLAAKTFMDMDKELVRLQKVYGSGFTFGEEFREQSEMVRQDAMKVASEMARVYGQAGTETAALMADLAATGFEGEALADMTRQTTKLATLGEVDRQTAMKATVALQSAFKMSTDEVADSVLFLNAVENQTSASLQDLVEAIPRAGTVVEGLGGSVKDLALYMVAMREGGISAAEGANALKSGLSSIIAPAPAAVEFMKEFGINLPAIVQANAGKLTPTLMAFQDQLKGLDDLARQQVITKLFGKYQFARMNAFFNNLDAKGSQTQDVIRLMGTSIEDLSKLADQETRAQAESVSGQWTRAWEEFKMSLNGVGEEMLKWGTVALEVVNKVFKFINENDIAKSLLKWGGLALTIVGPIIMAMGLFGNMIGMLLKGILRLVNGFKVLKSGQGISSTFKMLSADTLQVTEGFEMLDKEIYDHAKAQDVVAQGAREWAAAMEGVTAATLETVAAIETLTSAQQQSIRATQSGLGIRSMPGMVRAHDLPRNPGMIPTASGPVAHSDIMLQNLQRIGYLPAEMTSQEFAKVSQRLNLGAYGYSIQSFEANDIAKNTPQMFAGTLAGPVSTQQSAAMIDPQRFLAQKTAVLQALGAEKAAVDAWAAESMAKIRAMQQAQGTQLDAATLHTTIFTDGLATLGSTFDQISAKLNVREALLKADDSKWATPSRDKVVMDAFLAAGGSAAILDMDMEALSNAVNAAQVEINAMDTAAMQRSITSWAESADASSAQFDMLKRQAQVAGASMEIAGTKFSQTSLEGLEAAEQRVIQKLDQTNAAMSDTDEKINMSDVSFVAVENANGKYVAAVNKMTGQVYAISNQSGRLISGGASKNAAEAAQLATIRMAEATQTQMRSVMAQAMDIMTSQLTAEQQIAALRERGLITESDKLALEMSELTYEERQTAENLEQYILEQKQTIEDGKQAGLATVPGTPGSTVPPVAPPGTGIRGRMGSFFSSPRASMYTGGALMGGAMLGTMLGPEGPVGDIANMTMMGAGIGGMFGPWGLAIGGAAGLITGGLMEAFEASAEESKRRAEEAAAAWNAEFGQINISAEVAEQLKLGKLDIFIRPEVDLAGLGIPLKTASEEYSAAVAEQMKSEIEMIEKMTDRASVVEFGRNMFDNLIASGAEAADALKLVNELMNQTDNEQAFVELELDITLDEKQAEKNIKKRLEDVTSTAVEQFKTSKGYDLEGVINQEGMSNQRQEWWDELGAKSAEAYYNGLKEALDTGAIKANNYFSATARGAEEVVNGMLGPLRKEMGEIFYQGSLGGSARSELQKLGLVGNTIEELADSYNNLTEAEKQAVEEAYFTGSSTLSTEQARELNILTNSLVASGDAYSDYLAKVREADPAIAGNAAEILELRQAQSLDEATVMALARANDLLNESLREQRLLTAFSKSAYKYIPEPEGLEKTNIARLEKSQEEEMEALQESEDEKLEALEKAAEKRERLIQREIDQTNNQYDREIEKIQDAEDARQEAFEKEEERAQRRMEMRNMEISYQEAIANGELYEAARIRMDIAATKKQRDREDKQEKSQDQADKRIEILEKERDKKVRMLEKQLRIEQRMNERALEAAREASEARIEAEQEANEKEIRNAEKTNSKIENNQKQSNDRIEKMMTALRDGDLAEFRKHADALKMTHNDRVNMMMDFAKRKFGDLPGDAWDSVSKAIRSGDWQLIGQLMSGKIRGLSRSQLADISRMYGNRQSVPGPSGGDTAMASGGFVSGPGSGTSDSVNAKLSNGEYVIRQRSVARYGKGAMDAINSGRAMVIPKFADGGQFGMGEPILRGILGPPLDLIASMISSAARKSSGNISMQAGAPGAYGSAAFDAKQLKNAAIIVSVGKNMGASHRDLIIALMTAMQESTLHNYKSAVDHDSLGLFQQRPSMGWGTPKQLTNPKYASRKFFQALFGIENRDSMSLTDAAQAVQRSAYPDAYAKWEDEARAVLSGMSRGGGYVKPFMGAYPVGRTFAEHGRTGLDVPMPEGTPLRAVTNGRLTNNPFASGSYGNWYMLDANGYGFVYAHLSRDKASTGPISAGEIIGYSGNTGNSTGPHLHFEARRAGSFLDQADPHTLGIPGLRKGGKINYDNTVANLHRGETVLTSALTKRFEDNIANAGGNEYNFDVTIENLSSEVDLERAFEKFVVRHENRQAARNGRGRRI
jgi:TP901 family phage tail tape measure protein